MAGPGPRSALTGCGRSAEPDSCFLEVAGGWCGGGSAPYPRLVFGVAARPPFFSKKGEEGWGTGAATGRGNAPGKEGCDPTRSTPKRAEGSPQEHTSLRSKG